MDLIVKEIPQGKLEFEFEHKDDKRNFAHISIMRNNKEVGAIYGSKFIDDGNQFSPEEMKEINQAVEIVKKHFDKKKYNVRF